MTPSQHLLELNRNLQRRVAQVEQDNQQKKAELAQLRQEYERLQQSEARYRQLFENAPVSMLFISTEGYITQMNRAAEQQFGLSMEQLNKQASPIFTNTQLVENGTLPYMLRALAGETVIEEPTYYDSSKEFECGKFQYAKGHYCPIRDSEEVVREIVEIGPDFSDLLASQQKLQQERERAATERIKLLNTIAQVANLLLRSPDYTSVLPDVVRLLGEAVGSARCTLTQDVMHPELGVPAVRILTEWCRESVPTSIDCTPNLETAVPWDDLAQFRENHLQGVASNFLMADLQEPARSILLGQGLTSLLVVPIMVQGKCWGEIGFDNCGTPRLFDEAEVAILRIAADSIAAAIERQEKDDELRRSEALYRSLFEISNEGIYRWQLEQPVSVELPVDEQVELVYRYHSFAQANDALAKMYGLAKAEDIVGMRLSQVHPPDSAITLEMMRAICGNGWQIRNAESEEIDVNGQKRYYLNSIISEVENGSVSSGWGTQIDITELREAQQALLEAEQARAELLKTMTTIANHLLRSTDYRLLLPDVLQLLGEAARADRCGLVQNITDPASGKSAMRMNAEWCRPGIQASVTYTPELESALLWSDFAELYERLIQGETVQFFGTDLGASLRELFEAQGNTAMLMVPIVVQGEFWGVFGFDYCGEVRRFEELDKSIFAIAVDSIAAAIERQQQDEALRESEKRYRTLFELSNEGIYRFEFEQPISILLSTSEQIEQVYRYYRIAEVNSTFVTQYGLTNQDELIGSGLIDTHVIDSEVNYEHAQIIIENGYCGRNVETEEIDSEGQQKYFLQNIVCDVKNGYLWGGWGTQTNITELKQTQQALLQAEQERTAELVKANEALKRSLDALATDLDLSRFLGHVLKVIAQELDAPVVEHWFDTSGNISYLNLSCCRGEILTLEQQVLDPRVQGVRIPPELMKHESLLHRQQPVIVEDLLNDPVQISVCAAINFDLASWSAEYGVRKYIHLPLVLGEQGLGTLCVYIPDDRTFTEQQIELLRALAQQVTLATQLTQLAEQAQQAAIAHEQEKAALERAAELTQLNAALSASEARLRTLFEQIPVSLQIFSSSGICLEVNSAWSELWQLPSSAVIGKSCLVTRSNPESQLPSPFTPYLQRCFAGEAVVVPPLLFDPVPTFKVGRPRWVQTYIYPIKDRANRLREVLLIHQDIHALKQAEQVARGQTEALIQVLSALVSEPDIDQLLPSVMSITTAQLNAPASTLWLCDTQTGFNLLHLVCCGNQVSRELPVRMRADIDSLCLLLDSPTMQQMERTPSPIVLTDIATHPALEHLRPWLLQQQVRALMLVPLLLGNHLIGCVGIHNSTSNYFRCEEISLAQALAHQITLAFQLTQLAQQARLAALFEERNRIAGEIHDTLAQTFTGISIQLDVAKRIVSLAPQEARQILERVGELAHLGLKEAKRSVWALYSPTTLDADLAQSLRHSVEQMTNDTEIAVEFNVEGTPCSLTMDVSQNLLRMGQEALTNILKHAQARAIWIELVYEAEYVCLSVRDDGRGFVLSAANNSSRASFGLMGMYQRAERIGGELTITTQPGQGTEISVRVPVS